MITDKEMPLISNAGGKRSCIAFTEAKWLLKTSKLPTQAIPAQRTLKKRIQIQVSLSSLFMGPAGRRIPLMFICSIQLLHLRGILTDREKQKETDVLAGEGLYIIEHVNICKPLLFFTIV